MLGKEIATCLDQHQLTLVPNYESHDLKHVLLDYKMTAEDEIRMQAFMFGNGNYSIPCFAILAFGAVLLPDLWSTFYKDYKKGKKSIPISSWTIEDYATYTVHELRLKLNKPETEKRNVMNLKSITKLGAFASIIAGIFGMLFSVFILVQLGGLSWCRVSFCGRRNFISWRINNLVEFISTRKKPAAKSGLVQ